MWTRLLLVMLIDYIIVTILSLALLGLLLWYESIPFHHFSAVPCPRRRCSAVHQQLDNALLEVDNKGWPHVGAARAREREREAGKGKRIRVRRIVCVVNYCISSSFARESSRIPWQERSDWWSSMDESLFQSTMNEGKEWDKAGPEITSAQGATDVVCYTKAIFCRRNLCNSHSLSLLHWSLYQEQVHVQDHIIEKKPFNVIIHQQLHHHRPEQRTITCNQEQNIKCNIRFPWTEKKKKLTMVLVKWKAGLSAFHGWGILSSNTRTPMMCQLWRTVRNWRGKRRTLTDRQLRGLLYSP